MEALKSIFTRIQSSPIVYSKIIQQNVCWIDFRQGIFETHTFRIKPWYWGSKDRSINANGLLNWTEIKIHVKIKGRIYRLISYFSNLGSKFEIRLKR